MSVAKIVELANCSEEDAESFLAKTNNDLLEALSLAMDVKPKVIVLNEEQQFFTDLRQEMDRLVEGVKKGFIAGQSELSECSEKPCLLEEKVQQKNYLEEYHPDVLESRVQIPEIVYPLQSEYSFDSPLNVQK